MSAVSLVDSINILLIQAFGALAAGGCIVCSQYIGKKNEEAANKAAGQVLLVIFAISAVIAVIPSTQVLPRQPPSLPYEIPR